MQPIRQRTVLHHTALQRNGICRLMALVMLLASATAAHAVHPYQKWADKFGMDLNASYDGTRVMRMDGYEVAVKERKAPGKMYTEVQMQGMSAGVILREDLDTSYMLMPSMGFYREQPLNDGIMQASGETKFSRIKEVGRETVLGFPSTKYQTKFSDQQGKGAGHIWVTDTGVPIKMDILYSSGEVKGKRMQIEFTELNMRAQDPSHFELPKDLQPMNMGNMAGMAQQMMQAQQAEQVGAQGQQPQQQPTESNAGDRLIDTAAEEAEAGVQEETRNAIREGIRGIFRR